MSLLIEADRSSYQRRRGAPPSICSQSINDLVLHSLSISMRVADVGSDRCWPSIFIPLNTLMVQLSPKKTKDSAHDDFIIIISHIWNHKSLTLHLHNVVCAPLAYIWFLTNNDCMQSDVMKWNREKRLESMVQCFGLQTYFQSREQFALKKMRMHFIVWHGDSFHRLRYGNILWNLIL